MIKTKKERNMAKWHRIKSVNKWFWMDRKRYIVYMRSRLMGGLNKENSFLMIEGCTKNEISIMFIK